MGLAPILVERSFEIIQQVHESGVAMLIVEQNANVSLSIADRGYVLSTGRVVLEGRRRTCSRTRICGRPTLVGSAIRGVRAGSRSSATRSTSTPAPRGALGRRAGRVRGVPRRLGRERGRVGALGRALRGGAGRFAGLLGAGRTTSRSRPPSPPRSARLVSALRFRGGRNRIVISENEFPTIGQIAHAQELRGAEVVQVEPDPGGVRGRGRRADRARRLDLRLLPHRRGARRRGDPRGRARARRADARRRLPGGRRDAARRARRRRRRRRRHGQVPARLGRARVHGAPAGARRRPLPSRPAGSRTRTSSTCRSSATARTRAPAASTPARRRCRTSTPASPGSA